jgi:hypothetical protein
MVWKTNVPPVAACLLAALVVGGCGSSSGGSSSGSSAEKHVTVAMGKEAPATGPNGTAKVRLAVEVAKGTAADLANFRLSMAEKRMTPWYVTSKVRNAGSKPVTTNDSVTPLVDPYDDHGLKAKGILLLGTFDRCKLVNMPDPFPAGADYTSCKVYLTRAGSPLAKVVYSETRFHGPNRVYTWRVR